MGRLGFLKEGGESSVNTVEKLVLHLLLTNAPHHLLGFVAGEMGQRMIVREISQPLAQARPCEIRGQPSGPHGGITLVWHPEFSAGMINPRT